MKLFPIRLAAEPRTCLLVGAVVVMISVQACCSLPPDPAGGTCCTFTGPVPWDCEAIENLGPGADLDGRCNQVNQGQSCSWDYSIEECCEIAVDDGFGDVTCGHGGTCCTFTGPEPWDCEAIENLGPGADLDGRCDQVNQGQSCSWDYSDGECCEIAVDDGFPGSVVCD